jgi:hypothetical protein
VSRPFNNSDALTEAEDNVLANARMSHKVLEIAVEALIAIALHRESLEGRAAIRAIRQIREVMTDAE